MLPKNVVVVLIRLGNFFNVICNKFIKWANLEELQAEIKEIEYELEKIFIQLFFNIIEHLLIYLVDKIKIEEPNHLRYMYPMDKKLCELKDFAHN